MNVIRMALQGTSNTRDIGGYVCSNGRAIKWRKILRSDGLSNITDKDQDLLITKYNLKKVIDLRTESEIIQNPNIDYSVKNINYINIPLSNGINPNELKKIVNEMNEISVVTDFAKILINSYMDIVDNNQVNIRKTIEEIADVDEEDCVLFHCTAGKDRTGIISMLILGICGASKQDITTNYVQTEINMKYNKIFTNYVNEVNSGIPDNIITDISKARPECIEYAYDYLKNKYGSFHNYFLTLGLTDEFITKFKDDLTFEI